MTVELKAVLERQLAALVQMRGLLEREIGALINDEESGIAYLAVEKPRVLAEVSEASRALEGVLKGAGLSTDAEGLRRCIARREDSFELDILCNSIIDQLRACADHNRMNSGVLERKRATLERALRILVAQDVSPNRYHATGKLENFGTQRSIGAA